MKTLEIGNYLVVDLYCIELTELDTHRKVIRYKQFYQGDIINSMFKYPSSFNPLGFGKDYPELIQELGVLSENPVEKPVYSLDKTFKNDPSHKLGAIGRYNQQLREREEAEKYVFKNPYILHRNDKN